MRHLRKDGGLLAAAVVAALVARELVVELRSREHVRHGPRALVLDVQSAECHAHVAHLTPVLAPAVANDPVPGAVLLAPADDRDHVVNAAARALDHAALVVEERHGVDATADG